MKSDSASVLSTIIPMARDDRQSNSRITVQDKATNEPFQFIGSAPVPFPIRLLSKTVIHTECGTAIGFLAGRE